MRKKCLTMKSKWAMTGRESEVEDNMMRNTLQREREEEKETVSLVEKQALIVTIVSLAHHLSPHCQFLREEVCV